MIKREGKDSTQISYAMEKSVHESKKGVQKHLVDFMDKSLKDPRVIAPCRTRTDNLEIRSLAP